MVRHVDAIYSQGALRPLEPLALPEGARVRLSLDEQATSTVPLPRAGAAATAARIHSPKLAHREDAADFVMEVRETGHASV
jgi:predicted DNA-binding antitoxin AbrB/MazE fold protein